MRGCLPLIWKDSTTHMHVLTVCVKEVLPFSWDLSLESSADSYLCFWLALLHSVPYFFSSEIDRPGELCYNFSNSNDLTEIVHFPTRIPDCDSYGPALLDLFISSDASICSTMAFLPLSNSDHVVSVSIDFCQVLSGMPCFIT